MEGRVFENFQKTQKSFKFPKTPKIVPKSIQTCFEQVLGQTFGKFFAQFSMEGRVFENFQKKCFQNSKNAQKCSKVSKRVLGWFFRKKFMPGVPWRVEFSKIFKIFFFKIPKMHKIVPESIQACFERVLGQIFRKFYAQCSMEGRVFENFPKFFFSKFQKRPKSFPKESKRVLIVIWTIFSKNFYPVFHGRSSLRKFSKNSKKFQIS